MTLFEQWKDLIKEQSEESFKVFWDEYSRSEASIYKDILARAASSTEGALSGRVGDLCEKFKVRDIIFVGFLDGVQTSLINEGPDLDKVDLDTEIDLKIDLKELLYRMFEANAEHLFGLDEWHDIFSEEEMREIYKKFRRSKTVVKGKKIGRNEPCPCGSGKKYKHCCGRNQ